MSITLRPYQDETITTILNHATASFAVEEPTGAGKTVEILALAALLTQTRNKRVIIGTPQVLTERGFTARHYSEIRRQNGTVIQVPATLLYAARDDSAGCIRAIRNFLDSPAHPGHILVCTHQALTFFKPPTSLPSNLADFVLLIDEFHHASALGLGQFFDAWRATESVVHGWSATLYRVDGEEVVRAGMRLIRRPLPLHMEEGYAPGRLVHEVLPIAVGGVVSVEEFHGEEAPAADQSWRVVQAMVQRWHADERPKTIVRVPVLRGGSGPMVAQVIGGFSAAGARVLDASGQEPADQDRVTEALTAERAETSYHASSFDIIVGIQRPREGMDWPFCSTFYSVGLPRHPQTVTQYLGRTLRLKQQRHYPAEQRQRAKIVFFVPQADASHFADVREEHVRQTLVVCSFLSNSACAIDWLLVKHIASALSAPLSTIPLKKVAASYPYVDPALRAQTELALEDTRVLLLAAGSTAPIKQMVEMTIRRHPEIAPARIKQVYIEQLAVVSGEVVEVVKKRVSAALRADVGTTFNEQLVRQVFEEVLEEFKDAVVNTDSATARLRGQVLTLTGRQLSFFAQRLAQARPLDPEWLARLVHDHHSRFGSWPTAQSRGPVTWPDESWAAIDAAIRERKRGWPLFSCGNLRSFVRLHAERGTLGQQLKEFAEDLWLEPVESAFVAHLLKQNVTVQRQTVPIAELPALATNADHDYAWALARWFTELIAKAKTVPRLTLAELYLVELWANLDQWLKMRSHPYTALPPGGDHAAHYEVRFQVPGSCTCRIGPGGPLLPAGSMCYGVTRGSPLARGGVVLHSTTGQPLFLRGIYHPCSVPAAVYMTARGAPSSAQQGELTSLRLPLFWIKAILVNAEEVAVPADWPRALAQLTLPAFEPAARAS